MATDLPTLNLDELDYDDDVIEDKPTSVKSRSRESTPDRKSEKSDDGEISASDDGEIKSGMLANFIPTFNTVPNPNCYKKMKKNITIRGYFRV